MPLSSACLLWRDSTPNGIYAKHWEAVKLSEEEILSWEQVGVLAQSIWLIREGESRAKQISSRGSSPSASAPTSMVAANCGPHKGVGVTGGRQLLGCPGRAVGCRCVRKARKQWGDTPCKRRPHPELWMSGSLYLFIYLFFDSTIRKEPACRLVL